MNTIAWIDQAKTWIARSLKTQLLWKLMAGAALGALFLTAVVGSPFGSTGASVPTDTVISTSVNAPAMGQQPIADRVQEDQDHLKSPTDEIASISTASSRAEVSELFGEDAVAALGYEVLMARLNNYLTDGSLSSRDLERLDQEIDLMLTAAVERSLKRKAAYQQGIQRAKEEINALLAEARQYPTMNPSRLDREVRRLDHQIDTLRLAVMHDF